VSETAKIAYWLGVPLTEFSRDELIEIIHDLGRQLEASEARHMATLDIFSAARRVRQQRSCERAGYWDEERVMKLFVWNDPYTIPYGSACAYAVAETEDQARDLVKSACISHYGLTPSNKAPEGMDIDRPADRELTLPCAEIYQWQE